MRQRATSESATPITFRRLRDDDLPLMHAWLNDPAVVRWWEGTDVSWPAVVEQYGSANTHGIEHWLALLDGDPLGWIQCYPAQDAKRSEAYYWRRHLNLRKTGGIDYLVGESGRRQRGMGSAMIHAFVRDVLFPAHPGWRFAAAGPFEANVASWKALQKAGFRRVATLDDEQGTCVLMVAERGDFETEPGDGGDGRGI